MARLHSNAGQRTYLCNATQERRPRLANVNELPLLRQGKDAHCDILRRGHCENGGDGRDRLSRRTERIMCSMGYTSVSSTAWVDSKGRLSDWASAMDSRVFRPGIKPDCFCSTRDNVPLTKYTTRGRKRSA